MIEPATDKHSSDRAVFVTDDDRRARRLRRGAFVAAALAVLWLVGLGVGMLGFGSLPGISLGKQNDDAADRSRGEPVAEKRSQVVRPPGSDRSLVVSRRSNLQRGSLSRVKARVQPAPPAPPAAKPVAPPPAQQPSNPAGRQRGWARKGLPAPPGQVKKAQPKPPPGERGRGQGQTNTTTTTPVPPGQAKKTPPPPPEG